MTPDYISVMAHDRFGFRQLRLDSEVFKLERKIMELLPGLVGIAAIDGLNLAETMDWSRAIAVITLKLAAADAAAGNKKLRTAMRRELLPKWRTDWPKKLRKEAERKLPSGKKAHCSATKTMLETAEEMEQEIENTRKLIGAHQGQIDLIRKRLFAKLHTFFYLTCQEFVNRKLADEKIFDQIPLDMANLLRYASTYILKHSLPKGQDAYTAKGISRRIEVLEECKIAPELPRADVLLYSLLNFGGYSDSQIGAAIKALESGHSPEKVLTWFCQEKHNIQQNTIRPNRLSSGWKRDSLHRIKQTPELEAEQDKLAAEEAIKLKDQFPTLLEDYKKAREHHRAIIANAANLLASGSKS